MIKLIFTLTFFLFIALFGVWVDNNNFPIVANFLNYQIETTAAKLSVAALICFVFIYGILRLFLWVKNSPARFASKLQKDKEKQGYKDLMQGFSALAAGDMSYAKKLSDRAEKALEGQPLVKLLQAQVSVLANKPFEAEKYYSEMTKIEESRIIGYRGLISQAIESRELGRALELAEDLHKLNPNAIWVNEAMIDLAFRNHDWERAEKFTLKAQKSGALNRLSAQQNLAIVHYFYALKHAENKEFSAAVNELKSSLKNNPKFLPANILLARAYYEEADYKAAAKHIELVWKTKPHPQLAEIYELVINRLDPDKKLKKFEKLMKSNPDDIESILAYAQVAVRLNYSDKAKIELERALQIRETKKVCHMLNQFEKRDIWRVREENAEHDKCWHCSQTGIEYTAWQLYSNTGTAGDVNRGFFNTIIWDYPQQSFAHLQNLQNPMDSFLLIK